MLNSSSEHPSPQERFAALSAFEDAARACLAACVSQSEVSQAERTLCLEVAACAEETRIRIDAKAAGNTPADPFCVAPDAPGAPAAPVSGVSTLADAGDAPAFPAADDADESHNVDSLDSPSQDGGAVYCS